MGNCLRRVLHRAATGLVALLGLFALAAAALHGFAFYLSQNPDDVAGRIAAALDHPVTIDELDVAWRGRGLILDIAGVRLGGGDDALALPRLQVDLDLLGSVLAGEPRFRTLTLADCRVTLVRERDGSVRTAGIDLEIRNRGLLDALMAKSGGIHLIDSEVILEDRRLAVGGIEPPHLQRRRGVSGATRHWRLPVCRSAGERCGAIGWRNRWRRRPVR